MSHKRLELEYNKLIEDLKKYESIYKPIFNIDNYEGSGKIYNWNYLCCNKVIKKRIATLRSHIKSKEYKTKCEKCINSDKRIKQIHNFIKKLKRPIKLLSTTYINCKEKLDWECLRCELKFKRTLYNMKKTAKIGKGWGCPDCANDNSEYIKKIKVITKKLGIIPKNLTSYSTSNKKIDWVCLSHNHEFESSWNLLRDLIKRKSKNPLCRICANRIYDKEIIQENFNKENRNILILSKKIKNFKQKLKVKCLICNHGWPTTLDSLSRKNRNGIKSGCPKCAGVLKYNYKEVKKYINNFNPNIKLISNKYRGIFYKLKLECKECGLNWQTSFNNLKNGKQGCPDCNQVSKKEKQVRDFLFYVFKEKFIKIKLPWLINPKTNFKLEADCYSEKLKLNIEINGKQHYVFNKYLHRTIKKFQEAQYRDQIKKELFIKQGINFIELPIGDLSYNTIKNNLKQKLIDLNYFIPENWDKTSFPLSKKELNIIKKIRNNECKN